MTTKRAVHDKLIAILQRFDADINALRQPVYSDRDYETLLLAAAYIRASDTAVDSEKSGPGR